MAARRAAGRVSAPPSGRRHGTARHGRLPGSARPGPTRPETRRVRAVPARPGPSPRETVLLGMALMYDDTIESFQWLLETFLHATSGQAPRTIFSRQDAIVAKAISLVMPDTCHAICTWHLKQAAKKNLNHLIRWDCDFMKEFKACINDYEEEMELFTSWEAMINKYSLHGNVWLQKVFEEKEKWARPYMSWIFSAGMKNTQLNERLHSDVQDYLRFDVDIILLLRHLQKVINDRRYRELEVEFSSRLKLPDIKIRAPILRQGSEAYTGMIFQLFQEEYEEFQSAYIMNRDECGPCREYIVAIIEKERQYKVYGNLLSRLFHAHVGSLRHSVTCVAML